MKEIITEAVITCAQGPFCPHLSPRVRDSETKML